ncbi:BatD family protein [Hymenobacter properus]|uniref:BatD family protein n=1 Tax=Hymenobacter properus TaxID=2791026 RepID=A0A931FKV1_9BACT|nr:BatD family protein [Hymenobacter properus]MBF9141391.1 BatD family protein [Hymenobacter properus]MBR7720200.1 BatD family protein [Microvirga sp. SRT04]
MAGLWWLLGLSAAVAQPAAVPKPAASPAPADVELVPGPSALPVTGVFTLGFRLRGGTLEKYSDFPELDGFKKAGKTRTNTVRTVQGRRFVDVTITQRYVPYGEGDVVIKPFQLTVNGVVLRSSGSTVHVGPAPVPNPGTITKPANPTAPLQAVGDLDKMFGKPKPVLYQDVPDHAFLAVVAERPRVFVGEGVRVGLYFYLKPEDQALLAFHDFNDQLPPLLHELHQPTAWQEPGPEASVTPDTVRHQGERYLRFRLAENIYYPLTAQPLHFPPLALTMVKFKVLKKPEPGQDNRLAGYKTYYAPGLSVQVQPLPQAEQRGAVAVGTFQVREAISRIRFRVGESFTYTFGVEGRGNLAAVLAPEWPARPGLEVFGPEVKEAATSGGGRKMFRYRLVARRPGVLPLDSLIRLVVFNPATAHYDTLRPELRPNIQGVATPPASMPKPEDDPFYGPALASADDTLQSLDVYRDVRRYADWLLIGLAGLAGFGWWRAGRRA